MNTATATLTRYHVTVGTLREDGTTYGGGRWSIMASTREEAAELALDRNVEAAKAYNARYAASMDASGVSWAKETEAREAFAVVKVRKAPAKK